MFISTFSLHRLQKLPQTLYIFILLLNFFTFVNNYLSVLGTGCIVECGILMILDTLKTKKIMGFKLGALSEEL